MKKKKQVEIMGYKLPRSNNLGRVSNSVTRNVSSFSEATVFSTCLLIHVGILPLVSYSTEVNFSKP